MFTWPLVLLVVLGIGSLVAAAVVSIRFGVLHEPSGEARRDTDALNERP